MNNSNSGNVGIVIVSHSPKIAEGAADMVRQMVGNAVPLAWTGGDIDGGLGTNVAGILEAIETAWMSREALGNAARQTVCERYDTRVLYKTLAETLRAQAQPGMV